MQSGFKALFKFLAFMLAISGIVTVVTSSHFLTSFFLFLAALLFLIIGRVIRSDKKNSGSGVSAGFASGDQRSTVNLARDAADPMRPVYLPTPATVPPEDFLSSSSAAYVAFDLETTGLSPAVDAIIEIGAVKVRDGAVIEEFSQLVDPGFPIPQQATEVNHITDAMVAGMPSIQKALIDFLIFIEDYPCVAHNAKFDMSFLYAAVVRCGLDMENDAVDTLKMARKFFSQLPDKKLATVCDAIGYQIGEAHRALDDAKAVHAIVQACSALFVRLSPLETAYYLHFDISRKIRDDYRLAQKCADDATQKIDAVLSLCREDFSLVQPAREYAAYKEWPAPRFDSFRRAILIYTKQKDFDAAIEVCKQAISLDIPDDSVNMSARLERLYAQRESYHKKQKQGETSAGKREKEQRVQQEKTGQKTVSNAGTNKRKIIQLSYDGTEVVKTHESIASAAREIGIDKSCIRDAINGKQKHAGGFSWKLAEQSDTFSYE